MFRLALAAVALLAMAGGAAHAKGQLQVRQTGVDLPAGIRGGRLVLGNAGDASVTAQVRVFAWSQDDSGEHLEATDAIAVSPPVVDIPAGGEQLVRVVRTGPQPARETAYRLVVDELPGGPGTPGASVQVRLRYLIPVFVRAEGAPPPQLACRIEQGQLGCRNSGGIAAQLGATALVARDGRRHALTQGLLGYVLAGSTRHFDLDATAAKDPGAWTRLEVRLNGTPARLDLVAR